MNFELIVVDDHSNCNIKRTVDSFKDNRIRYVLNCRSKGGAGARNTGIFHARGDWIAFLDDDDVWLPQHLQLHHEKIQSKDNLVGLIYSGYATYDFATNREISSFLPAKEGWILGELLYKNYIGALCTVTIKRDIIISTCGFDEQFESMQDMELYVRIANCCKILAIKEKSCYVRVTNSDRVSFNIHKKLSASIMFWEKYKDAIDQKIRLKHRAAARVFIFAIRLGDIKRIMETLPLLLAGIFVDLPNFIWVLKYLLAVFVKPRMLNIISPRI